MGRVFQSDWELSLIRYLQDLIASRPYLKGLFVALTQLGEPFVPVLIIGFLYWGYRKKWGIYMALCALNAQVVNNYLKNIVCRLRPYMCNEDIVCLKPVDASGDIYDVALQGYSFPSGHSSCVSGFMSSLWFYKKLRPILYVSVPLIISVAVSRFALGVHYPTDVICGGILGILVTVVTDHFYERIDKRLLYLFIAVITVSGFVFCRSEDYFSVSGLTLGFLAGDLFEERYVRFHNTKNIVRMILRTLIGGLVFLALSQGLKYLFVLSFPDVSEKTDFVLRSFRYMISTFSVIGLYPYCFRFDLFRFHK